MSCPDRSCRDNSWHWLGTATRDSTRPPGAGTGPDVPTGCRKGRLTEGTDLP